MQIFFMGNMAPESPVKTVFPLLVYSFSCTSFLLYRALPEPGPWWVEICPSLPQAFLPLFFLEPVY
jgi:hypothetical protein